MANDATDERQLVDDASSHGDGSEGKPAAATGQAGRDEAAFTQSGSETVAALLHLIRLMGAELVLNHGTDVGQFERAVRSRIVQFTSPTANSGARESGLARAQRLVDQVLSQVRAQAKLKQTLKMTAGPRVEKAERTDAAPRRPALLN